MASVFAYRLHPEIVDRLPSGVFFRRDQLEEARNFTELFEKGIDPSLFPTFPAHVSEYNPQIDDEGGQGASRSAEHQIPSHNNDVRCLPLLDVNIEVDVKFTVARTRVFQTFTNLSPLVIKEANYSFPLYDGSAVIEFRCHIGEERVLEGVVKPKEVCLISNGARLSR